MEIFRAGLHFFPLFPKNMYFFALHPALSLFLAHITKSLQAKMVKSTQFSCK